MREKIKSAIIDDMIMLWGETKLRKIKHKLIGLKNAERVEHLRTLQRYKKSERLSLVNYISSHRIPDEP